MRNSSSDVQEEKLKSAYQSAKKNRKKAKANYKAKVKELKALLKPFKKALREAEKMEKKAKAAYNDFADMQTEETPVVAVTKKAVEVVAAAPRKRGRQPGFSPKAAAPATKTAPSKGGEDDLTQVKGVGDNISVMLKANGIKTFADMAATSFERYKELLKANGMSKFRDPSEWAARAAAIANLPAPAPAEKAAPAPKGVINHEEGYKKPKSASASSGGDDLTQVKGVGDNISVMLKANGIKTFADMAATSFERYKELLKANGMSKFRDPSEWAARAAAIANLPAPAKSEKKAAAAPAAAPRKRGRQPGFSPKAAKAAAEPAAAPRKRGRQPGFSPKAAKAAAVVAAPAKEAAPKAPAKPKGPPAKPDDLTQVKGVGQRVAEALNKEGIYTYKEMAAVSIERYKEILKDNNMSKFRDPSDWAKLAGELAGKK